MRKKTAHIILLLLIMSDIGSLFAQPLMESKNNVCFYNADKISGSAQPTFLTKNVIFGNFRRNQNYPDAIFLDFNTQNLILAPNNASLAVQQYNPALTKIYGNVNISNGNAVVADFNQDTFDDFAMINSTGDVLTFRNLSGSVFPRDSIANTLGPLALNGKLLTTNNDNNPAKDIISVGVPTSTINGYYCHAYKNISAISGALTFSNGYQGYIKTTVNIPTGGYDAAAIDLDKNGYDEIIFISEDSDSITVLVNILGNLSTKFTFGSAIPGLQNKKIKISDINNDGTKEIIILGKLGPLNYIHVYSPIYVGSTLLGFNPQKTLFYNFEINDFAFADFNEDGLRDLVINSNVSTDITIYLQNRSAIFNFGNTPAVFNVANHTPRHFATRDVDNNFREDIISFNFLSLNSIAILRNFTYVDSLIAIPASTSICVGDSITISNNLVGYALPYNSAFSPSISLSNSQHKIKIGSPGTFTSYATYASFFIGQPPCTVYSNTLVISPAVMPTVSVSGPSFACQNSSTTLTATGGTSFLWSSGETTSMITFTASGIKNYTVSGYSADGCKSIYTGSVGLAPPSNAIISADKIKLCNNEIVNLTVTEGLSFIWSTGSLAQSINVRQTSNIPQTYTVLVTDMFGCFKLLNYETQFNPDCKGISIKNGLTPNQDGLNDFFYIENIENYTDNNVSIYNRWGKLLFTTNGYNNADKVWPDPKAPDSVLGGTYFYVIKLGANEPIEKGWVEVFKN